LLAGFSDTLTIREEAAFDPWRNEGHFQVLLSSFTGQDQSGMDPLFRVFIQSFNPVRDAYALDTGHTNLRLKHSISYDFKTFIPEMQNTYFSRDVSHEYYYVAKVADEANYIAVIYSSLSYWEEEM